MRRSSWVSAGLLTYAQAGCAVLLAVPARLRPYPAAPGEGTR